MRIIAFTMMFFLCSWSSPRMSSESMRDLVNLDSLAGKMREPKPELNLIPELVMNHDQMRAGLLYDMVRNEVVWGKDMDTPYPIASLTKMMVSLMTFEAVNSGTYNWDTPIKASRRSSQIGGSTANIHANTTYTLESLLKAAMISSANDATFLLAEFMGGSEQDFVLCMNERAAELGMHNTRFYTSTGLPELPSRNNNYASPSDLLILARSLMRHERALEIAGSASDAIQHGKRQAALLNHNTLVRTYPNQVDGLKTGYTSASRFCLVATSDMNGRRLVSIALGLPTRYSRDLMVSGMLNSYYDLMGLGKMEPVVSERPTKKYRSKYYAKKSSKKYLGKKSSKKGKNSRKRR